MCEHGLVWHAVCGPLVTLRGLSLTSTRWAGNMYLAGNGVKAELTKAIDCFRKGVDAGMWGSCVGVAELSCRAARVLSASTGNVDRGRPRVHVAQQVLQ